jgi:hypothetical protein
MYQKYPYEPSFFDQTYVYGPDFDDETIKEAKEGRKAYSIAFLFDLGDVRCQNP